MTEQDYRLALHKINVKADNERRALAKAFATEHSPVQVGDYVTDQCGTISVEGWDVSKRDHSYNALPCLVYRGTTCKKDGTPRKHPQASSIYQCNLLSINGQPVKNHGYGTEQED